MTTIKLVLECASDIEYFSIIINKLSTVAYIYLVEDNGKHLKILVAIIIEQVNWKRHHPLSCYCWIKSSYTKLEELDKFAKEAPWITVTPASVVVINADPFLFQKVTEMLMQEIDELRSDNKRMMELQKETEEKYRKLLQIRSP